MLVLVNLLPGCTVSRSSSSVDVAPAPYIHRQSLRIDQYNHKQLHAPRCTHRPDKYRGWARALCSWLPEHGPGGWVGGVTPARVVARSAGVATHLSEKI